MRWKDDQKTVLIVKATADESMVRLAKQALQIQDACNLCGIAQAFAGLMKELLNHPQNQLGGNWANQHPIVHAWLDKMASLARYEQSCDVLAFDGVHALADGFDVEFEITPFVSDLSYLRQYDKIADAIAA